MITNPLAKYNATPPTLSDHAISELQVTSDGSLKVAVTTESGAGAATSAKQDTGNTSLASLDTKTPALGAAAMAASTPVTLATNDTQMAALILALSVPTTFTAVTPSDSTDLTAVATKGLYVTVAGAVYVRGTGDAGITNLGTFPVGTYIPGKFMRVGASSTATVVAVGG
jgi:hypothetical protein